MSARRFERVLADSETRLRLATTAAKIGIWDWDLRTNEMVYSDRAKEICNFPLDGPVTYEQVRSVTHPDDLPRTSAMVRRALDPDLREQQPYEYRLLLADGSVRWVLAYGQAVFEEDAGVVRATRYVGTIQDITDRHRSEERLRDSESRLSIAIDAARMAVWEYDIALERVSFSSEVKKLFGFAENSEPTIGDLRARYRPGERERIREAGRKALERGDRYFEIDFRILRLDGAVRWLLLRAEIQLDEAHAPRRVLGVAFDITTQKTAAERQALLVEELNHRVKNSLAIVQSITALTLRHSSSPEAAQRNIEERLGALARAHDLLTRQTWEEIGLRECLVNAVAVAASRTAVNGPDFLIRPRTAVDLSVLLHELLTNALKYGSLSAQEGRVSLDWADPAGGLVRLEWKERDGPTVSAPERRGFGSRLLNSILRDHGGRIEPHFDPDGFRYVIEFRP